MWPFRRNKKKRSFDFSQTKEGRIIARNAEKLIREAEKEIKNGTPMEMLYEAFRQISMQEDLERELRWAYSKASDHLLGIMVDRNNEGKELEKQGKIDLAIELYEANVTDKFDGSYPYDRLWLIYRDRGDYDNAIRICDAYIMLPNNRIHPNHKRKKEFAEAKKKLKKQRDKAIKA